jgi:hypothetical protein
MNYETLSYVELMIAYDAAYDNDDDAASDAISAEFNRRNTELADGEGDE